MTGKIAALRFDQFGDFSGFILESDDHRHEQVSESELLSQHLCDKENHNRSEDPSSGEQIDKRVTGGCDDGHHEG